LACFFHFGGDVLEGHRGLIHDSCEGFKAFDATPHDNISEVDKYDMELDTMIYIRDHFKLGPYYFELWNNTEDTKLNLRRDFKDKDKACPFIECLKHNRAELTEEFRNCVKKNIHDKNFLEAILQLEKEHILGTDPYIRYFLMLQENPMLFLRKPLENQGYFY
ncbi:MAG: hypothetical protein KC550_02385, partial [Nanoarchaeota archaeon]|nr:hypothetical protein [Nanoarchaeota archaeon]